MSVEEAARAVLEPKAERGLMGHVTLNGVHVSKQCEHCQDIRALALASVEEARLEVNKALAEGAQRGRRIFEFDLLAVRSRIEALP